MGVNVAKKTAEVAEVLNPGDDVRNDVAAAIKQLKGDEVGTVDAQDDPPTLDSQPADDQGGSEPAPKVDRPRDETGKFLPKDKADSAPEKVAAQPEQKSPPLDTAKASTAQPSNAVGAPPVSWAADAKSTWSALPPAVQQAVIKRESEVSNGFKQKSEEVRRYEQVISPLAAEAQRLGIPLEQGINSLMNAQRMLSDARTAPQAIALLAQQYGVDLAALAQNPPAPQQRVEQAVPPQFVEKVSTLESRLNDFLANQTVGVVESFAKSPGHEHYDAVESDLLRIIPLIQSQEPGLPHQEVLQKAYDQAIWLNPDVRAKIIFEQHAKAETDRVASLRTKETASRKAAVSVKGSSSGAMPPPKQANGSGDVYDDVRAALHQLRG